MSRYRLGVDVGGTHTDFVPVDGTAGRLIIEKVPSTPENPARAVIAVQGGDYGDPGRREREGLERDLEEGYVTKDGARRDYGADES